MSKLGTGRYGNFLRRYLGIAGDAPSVARELVPDINAVMEVTALPEYGFLQGEKRAVGLINASAAVGALSCAQILNPSNSGVLVVVEYINAFRTAVSGILLLGNGVFAGGAGSSSKTQSDTRWQTASPSLNLNFGTVTVATPVFNLTPVIQDPSATVRTWSYYPGQLVLQPGTQFLLFHDTNNEGIFVSLIWRERGIVPSELQQ